MKTLIYVGKHRTNLSIKCWHFNSFYDIIYESDVIAKTVLDCAVYTIHYTVYTYKYVLYQLCYHPFYRNHDFKLLDDIVL